MNTVGQVGQVLLTALVLIAIAAVIGLVVAFPIAWIWNAVVVPVCGFSTITWGQAWLLMLLMHLLTPSSSSQNI